MLTDELLNYLFDGRNHILTGDMRAWLGASRRFTTFVASFRDKIRKKLRVTQDRETLYDLRLELETAYLLLNERTLNVVYEPEQSGPGRSPDFAVTYTTSLTFMVEVTRLRSIAVLDHGLPLESDRFADAICSKLRQFLPQRSNILIVGVDAMYLTQSELQSIMLRIQQRAEQNDSSYWQRYGFRERTDFFKGYQRLSEIIVRSSQLQADEAPIVWVNSQANHSLPSKVRTVLYRSHTASSH
ncbi:MAG TPA: hypothetical protein VFQ23_24540 [Anaerolineales bacterium]|nr:hypothetical protein [Anaerolineales bacterium]